jgi:hypothetical protein
MSLTIINNVIDCSTTIGNTIDSKMLHHKQTMLLVMFDNGYLGVCTTAKITCLSMSLPISMTLHCSLKAQSNSPPLARQAHAAAQSGSSPVHSRHPLRELVATAAAEIGIG